MKDPQRTISVLLADDHIVVRETIAGMLATDEVIEVVGQANNGAEAFALAKEKHPDIVLLDVEMPVMGAEEAVGRIIEVSPTSKVIILTMYDDAGLGRTLLTMGASAYLVKSVSSEELLAAVKSIAGGEDRVILSLSRESIEQSGGKDQAGLSERELEILLFVARGMSNRQIASMLYLTEGTVKRHLHRIYAKLDVRSRGEATRKALCEGWITARDITVSEEE